MGTCYGKTMEYNEEDIKNHLELHKKYGNKPPIEPQKNPKSETLSDIDGTLLKSGNTPSRLSIFTQERVDRLTQTLISVIEQFEKSKKNTVVKKKLKSLKTPFELYFKLETIQSENSTKKRKLHIIYSRLKSLFTPAASMLYELNSDEAIMKKVDDNVQDYKILSTGFSEDRSLVIQVILMVTKKVLIVSSKSLLTVRVSRRVSDQEYVVVGESILRNGLAELENLKNLRESLENECEIHINGSRYAHLEDGYSCETMSKGDFNTSAGPMLLKPIFKKTFSKYYNNFVKEFVNFYLQPPAEHLIWFDEDPKKVEQIFLDQRRVFLEDWHKNPELYGEEWTEKLQVFAALDESGVLKDQEIEVVVQEKSFQTEHVKSRMETQEKENVPLGNAKPNVGIITNEASKKDEGI